jgi:hypothetical protein
LAIDLPSDIQNVNHVVLPDAGPDTFRRDIRIPIRQWIEQLRRTPQELTLHTDLPNLYARIVAILKRLGDANPQRRHQIDIAASDVIESVAQSFESNGRHGNPGRLHGAGAVARVQRHLRRRRAGSLRVGQPQSLPLSRQPDAPLPREQPAPS